MTLELFPRERHELAPGAVHLPGWLDVDQQRFLVERCRRWAGEGPGIRAAALPNGARMSVKTVCLGWHWIPYHYSRTRDDQDGSPVAEFPIWLGDLGREAVAHAYGDPARGLEYSPDIALINHYTADARLGMHRDSDERSPDPVVSISLGAPCLFRLGNPRSRSRPWTDVELRSSDLLVFGDESRLAYHGVPKLLPHGPHDISDIGLGEGRLNITLRVSGFGDDSDTSDLHPRAQPSWPDRVLSPEPASAPLLGHHRPDRRTPHDEPDPWSWSVARCAAPSRTSSTAVRSPAPGTGPTTAPNAGPVPPVVPATTIAARVL
jgi:DNA oxidative demethylase